MPHPSESSVELDFLSTLSGKGYAVSYGPEIAPYSENPLRSSFESPLLESVLENAVERLNPGVPAQAKADAVSKVKRLGTDDLMANNEAFHAMLTDGVTVEYSKDGVSRGVSVRLADFENPENNEFRAVNQFVLRGDKQEKRLDVVIFLNGIPLVVAELKNPMDEDATLERAFNQIQTYKKAVPSAFYYNALCVVSDGIDARAGSVTAPLSRYLAWKSPDKAENGTVPELRVLAERMLDKKTLLGLVRYCTVFESEETKDRKTGLLSITKVKKVAAYHQYYAVEKVVAETVRATSENGDRKVGVVWHTQGSGKSLTMVFYAGRLVAESAMANPTVVILTDRNDLDDQLFQTFGNCASLLRQTPVQATSREHLKKLLRVKGGGIVFTTIQKFFPEDGKSEFEALTDRTNVVVVADEAHRSQYGFSGKVGTDGDIRYGNAKYLRDALPNASFVGFTGTPIEKEDKSTPAVFGKYVDVYDIAQAVKDGATVPISYESRLVKIKTNAEAVLKIDAAIDDIPDATPEQKERAKRRNAGIDAIVGHPDRVRDVAKDLVEHFEARQEAFEGKAMLVCMTRQIAVWMYDEIVKLRPTWKGDGLMEGTVKVVMTSASDDPESFQPHATTKQDRKTLLARLKDPEDPLKLVIVQSMWLTWTDVPSLHSLYVDKKMEGANLMQAIARVNRVWKDKPGGLVVDYIGIGQDLRNAMAVYTESGGRGDAVLNLSEAVAGMRTKFEIVEQMFHGFDYRAYFKAETGKKLEILLAAENFVLRDEELKKRFLAETSALSKLYAMSVPSEAADALRDHVAFFQAVKARINKFSPTGGKSDGELDTAIRQIVDEALSSEGVVDIFEAAGIKSPSLEILSEEFLLEVKNMEHKNLAFALLKKLLTEEVKVRWRKNSTQGKRFSEMLMETLKRYSNNQIDTAQVIEELSELARELRLEDKKAEEIGLSPEEYAFYSILSQNSSTKFLEDHKMKELIHLIVQIVRDNATVDWNKREDVKAKLRLTVKKVLIKYGYPPDLARMEADRVLEQSELFAGELTNQ